MTNIILLGFVSFFVDISTEMVYPLIPLYLTASLGATPALVGIIEGIAESLASLLKVFSGYVSDRYHHKKSLAFWGYSASLFYKIALLLSSTWTGILIARVIDRFGKGIRTAPRDVLVCESAESGRLGKAYGTHKMLDMAGSALGILAAFFLMSQWTGKSGYRHVFLLSVIPACIGLIILLFVHETKRECAASQKLRLIKGFREADRRIRLFLLIIFVFNLGNSSNVFLLLRAQNLGFDPSKVILLYFLYTMVTSLLALPFGKLSDRIGRRKLLVAGYGTFGAVYLGFALAGRKGTIVFLFVLYGIYTALTAGIERALVAEISPPQFKGTVLGLYSSLAGIALLPASLIAGFLWDAVSPSAPFYLGGILAVLSALAVSLVLHDGQK